MNIRFQLLKLLVSGFLTLVIFSIQARDSDTLLVAINHSPPFIIESEEGNWTGISILLWEKIADRLDLNYQYREMALEDILKSLANNEIDLSINPMTVTSERSEFIHFSLPFYVSHSSVAITRISTWKKALQFIQSFFSLNFWRVILALFIVILIFGLLTWYFERKNNNEQFEAGWKGIGSGIWWSAVTMTTVGYGDKSPRSTGGRVIALVWMFTAIIIISGFTASITSSLTVNQLGNAHENIDDFKKRTVGTVLHSSHEYYLKRKFFKDVRGHHSLAEGLQALKNEEVSAFVYDEPILKYLIDRDSQYRNLQVLPIRFNQQFYAFSFSRKKSAVEDAISTQIMKNTESVEWNILLSEYDLIK